MSAESRVVSINAEMYHVRWRRVDVGRVRKIYRGNFPLSSRGAFFPFTGLRINRRNSRSEVYIYLNLHLTIKIRSYNRVHLRVLEPHSSSKVSKFSVLSPTLERTPTSKIITIAAGCFWGVEKVMGKYFKSRGLVDAKVGYANGSPSVSDITYKAVCSGTTGYAESLQISYEPSRVSLKEILDIFFRIHDPTTFNAQGPDRGSQYRSAVFVHDEEDLAIAKESKEYFQKEWYPNHKIATEIDLIKNWYDAEDYHQKYLDSNPGGYECPTHFLRMKPKA